MATGKGQSEKGRKSAKAAWRNIEWENPQSGQEPDDLIAMLEEEEEAGQDYDETSEADDFDEDGQPLGEGADDEEEERFPVMASSYHEEDRVVLDFASIHEIEVYKVGDEFKCRYTPQYWQAGFAGISFSQRRLFVEACARWMEINHQAFLDSKELKCFFEESDGKELTQKEFLTRVKVRVQEDQFSRILPSIYLVWEDGISLPLKALFSKEAKI